MHVSKNLGSKISAAHASRDDHVRGSGAYRRGQGGWQEMLLPSRSREGPGEGVWLVQHLPMIPSRSEEHTSEHQSLMRISYAVLYTKQHTLLRSRPTAPS